MYTGVYGLRIPGSSRIHFRTPEIQRPAPTVKGTKCPNSKACCIGHARGRLPAQPHINQSGGTVESSNLCSILGHYGRTCHAKFIFRTVSHNKRKVRKDPGTHRKPVKSKGIVARGGGESHPSFGGRWLDQSNQIGAKVHGWGGDHYSLDRCRAICKSRGT